MLLVVIHVKCQQCLRRFLSFPVSGTLTCWILSKRSLNLETDCCQNKCIKMQITRKAQAGDRSSTLPNHEAA